MNEPTTASGAMQSAFAEFDALMQQTADMMDPPPDEKDYFEAGWHAATKATQQAPSAEVAELDEREVAKLAWKHLREEDADSLTFDRSPEYFPQVSYSVPTVELMRFARSIAALATPTPPEASAEVVERVANVRDVLPLVIDDGACRAAMDEWEEQQLDPDALGNTESFEGGFICGYRYAAELLRTHLESAAIAAMPAAAPVVQQGDAIVDEFAQLGRFYGVTSTVELLRAMEHHIEQLQDAVRRNVKPWEDTFPPTLLPRYLGKQGFPSERAPVAVYNGEDGGCKAIFVPWHPEHGYSFTQAVTDQYSLDGNDGWRWHTFTRTPAAQPTAPQDGAQPGLGDRFTVTVHPVAVNGCDEACRVECRIGNQTFHVGADYWEARDQGEGFAAMLRHALGSLQTRECDLNSRAAPTAAVRHDSPEGGGEESGWTEADEARCQRLYSLWDSDVRQVEVEYTITPKDYYVAGFRDALNKRKVSP